MLIYKFSELKNFFMHAIAIPGTCNQTTSVDHDQAEVEGDTCPSKIHQVFQIHCHNFEVGIVHS